MELHAAAARLFHINKLNCADSLTISVLLCWLQGRHIPYTDLKLQVAEPVKVKVQFSSLTIFFLPFPFSGERAAGILSGNNGDIIFTL